MSVGYKAIGWSRQKRIYDLVLWAGIVSALVTFIAFQFVFHPTATLETAIIRATALTAFLLLHIILMIGPLCRLDKRFLPLLYNRRHMGVSMFIIALVHAAFSIIQFHSLGDTNAIVSIFTSNQDYGSISEYPFQTLGFFALIILFLMAATSHDFWLHNLSPRVWKGLHMAVYLAYGLIVVHVATGSLQYESHPVYWVLLIAGFITVAGLHLLAGVKSLQSADRSSGKSDDGFVMVCSIDSIDSDCGKSVDIDGQQIAVFRYDNKVSAVRNQCKHQMGPLAEGKVIDGCITCPWHGYQYLPHNGQSPPPFNEKIATYRVKIIGDQIYINPTPLGEGEEVEPAIISGS